MPAYLLGFLNGADALSLHLPWPTNPAAMNCPWRPGTGPTKGNESALPDSTITSQHVSNHDTSEVSCLTAGPYATLTSILAELCRVRPRPILYI